MKFCRDKKVPVFITGKNELSKEDVVRLLQESEVFSNKYQLNEDYFYGKHKILVWFFHFFLWLCKMKQKNYARNKKRKKHDVKKDEIGRVSRDYFFKL